jgi:aminoglycoside 6'-N-acetyltransferase I
MSLTIRRATQDDRSGWLKMRQKLWPDAPLEFLNFDLDDKLANPDYIVFVASHEDEDLIGFIEAGLRGYAEGCESSPVGYIEAWYVDEHIRGQNVGSELVHVVEQWAREKGCTEMASDTWLENESSIAAHLRLGYIEWERLVHFVKRL